MPTPAYDEEQRHFAATLAIVKSEKQKAEAELGIENGDDRFLQVIDDGSDDALVQQFVLRMKLRNLHQLRLSERSPYFARLDFTPGPRQTVPLLSGMRAGEKTSVYLGRWGVVETPRYQVKVADWRSPVANLYYSGQIGPVRYQVPDGAVEGELSLKRMFTVEDGRLLAMQDTGLVGQEKFLTDALSQVTTARLREVVTTIQAEQNVVIRHDPFSPLLVQGVAGSGKTTIALHRIAWILYHLQKTVSPAQLMILAPNPLFLNYISRVLPDLGVNEVRQTTFQGLCGRLLGKQMPKLSASPRLDQRLSMDPAGRNALDEALGRKGALSLGEKLDRFLERFENQAFPRGDVLFGSRVLVSAPELENLWLTQLRHFPFLPRVGEVRKVVAARVGRLAEELLHALAKATEEKLDALLRALPDGEDRRERVARLLASRDQRRAQLKEAQKQFLKAYDKTWPSMELLTVYGQFWQALAEDEPAYAPARDMTAPCLQKKQAAPEDLPALLWLGERLYGLKRMDVRHVVIDEAQDASPLQVKMLRRFFGHDAFTLVGDLWQGIYGDEGIRSWEDLCLGIFEKPPALCALSTSYRSTVEIMALAFRVMARHPGEGVLAARPVLRHGETPAVVTVASEAERLSQTVRALRAWQQEGFFSMAVLAKTEAGAKKLHQALARLLPEARLVTRGDAAFEGGVLVMGASLVKGLEFDCVLVADGEADIYPDDAFTAKLLYVLCTRPLHRLRIVSKGPPTALLGLEGP